MCPPKTISIQNNAISTVAQFASDELARYLDTMFGNAQIEKSFTYAVVPNEISFDGYRISELQPGEIRIEASHERGLLHGTYALLKQLGCSFLFPGAHREQVPTYEAWPLCVPVALEEVPCLEFRGLCLYNTVQETLPQTLDAVDWMAKNGFNFLMTSIHRLDDTGCGSHAILWDEIGTELLPALQKRGIVIDMSEHSTDYYFPKETLFAQHPEWFALVNGVRTPGQICYSNAEAVEVYANALADFAKNDTTFQFFGIWPLDGGGYCECEHCRDAQTIFKANAVIAKKIEQVRPDLIVEHLAYTPQSFARPTSEMPQNMCVLVCSVRDKVAYEWAVCAQKAAGAFYFDYMTADHYRYRSNVTFHPRYCYETVNALASYRYRGIVSLYLPVECWFQSSLNLWYLSKFLYQPTASMQTLHRQLACELMGTNLEEAGADILREIADDLLDHALWTGFPFSHDWYCEHITNRNTQLDAIHAKRFDAVCASVLSKLQKMQQIASGIYAENLRLLTQFVELQQLYYHGVDLYDAEKSTPLQAEPYFQKLALLEQDCASAFISEAYARWRITGRDNIFDVEKINEFQAQTEG